MGSAIEHPVGESGVDESENRPAPAAGEAARARLLGRVFDSLDDAGISYCVTHGHQLLPDVIKSDVDMVVSGSQMESVRQTLSNLGGTARLVQWIADSACWAAVAADGEPGRPAIVQLHFSPGFELAGRLWFTASEILDKRRRNRGFWIPSPETEFACICINRSLKGVFRPEHVGRLRALHASAPDACTTELRRFFGTDAAGTLISVIQKDRQPEAIEVGLAVPVAPPSLNSPASRLARAFGKWSRRLSRWVRPRNGLHVVFLGPDGVGKSTVIDDLRAAVLPAFLRTDYMTFAPSLIPGPLQPKKETPHQLPPRSFAGSMLKVAWWSVCYTVGYFVSVRPAAARASLILNHRYLIDAFVDPMRYRYSGPQFPLRLIWAVTPKPDLIFLLDAPAEVIQARKREVPAAETARQRDGYRAAVAGIRYAHLIDTDRPLPVVTDQAVRIIFDLMAARTSNQPRPEDR